MVDGPRTGGRVIVDQSGIAIAMPANRTTPAALMAKVTQVSTDTSNITNDQNKITAAVRIVSRSLTDKLTTPTTTATPAVIVAMAATATAVWSGRRSNHWERANTPRNSKKEQKKERVGGCIGPELSPLQ
jgi:hypothetical protein